MFVENIDMVVQYKPCGMWTCNLVRIYWSAQAQNVLDHTWAWAWYINWA